MHHSSAPRTAALIASIVLAGTVLAACGDDDSDAAVPDTTVPATTVAPPATTAAPTTTSAPLPVAVDVLSSLGVVAGDVGFGARITKAPHDVAESDATEALQAAAAGSASCAGFEQSVPLPFEVMSSAARIDFVNDAGGASWAFLVVMPDTTSASDFVATARTDSGFHQCITDVTADYLNGAVEPGLEITIDPLVASDSIAGFGDNQAVLLGNLTVSEGGTSMLELEAGVRYSQVDNVLLVTSGPGEMTVFAVRMAELYAAAR